MGRPIFFIQERVGKECKIFKIIKFRTMKMSSSKDINTIDDKLRITKFGQFLRNYSLDEIPEFFNILSGDMSLVGPRPLLVEYLPLYSKEQNRRHSVKPGITGLAQINGRNKLTWEKTFDLDLRYVDNNNLVFDVKIILITFKKIILKDGIDENNQITKQKFTNKSNNS